MASLRKRGDLQWEARIRHKGHPVQCKTFETKARAETWARQIENEMDRGIFVSRKEAKNTTLAEALDRYIVEESGRKKDVANRESRNAARPGAPIASCSLPYARCHSWQGYSRLYKRTPS